MKTVYYSLIMVALVSLNTSCNKVSYKKTKSGLLYKISSSSSSEPVVKDGDWLKVNFEQKLNDSVLQTSYGKMPVYIKVSPEQRTEYGPGEIFGLLRKGDSVIAVMMVDSLLKKNPSQPLPPFMKKGDKITTGFKVYQVFHSDSLYQIDAKAEFEKDQPRQKKEMAAQEAIQLKGMREAQQKDEEEMEKSGEADKGVKLMESYLAGKGIKAEKVGRGTFVVINQQGTGAQAGPLKYVTINYDGKLLSTDSTFDKGSFTRQLGTLKLISGLEDGLAAFKQGGKGVVYVPGFRAYGAHPNPQSPFKPFEPLKFIVEVVQVSDTAIAEPEPQMPQRRN